MDRQENKNLFDYQTFMNYNQSQWPSNQSYNNLFVNGLDSGLTNSANSARQMTGNLQQPTIGGLDYYQYGFLQTTQNNPINYTNELQKLQYKTNVYGYTDNALKDQSISGGIQRSGPLRAWLNTHLNDPYPSAQEKQRLAGDCNKSYIQVCTWFANARRALRRQGILGPRIRRNKSYDNIDSQSCMSHATNGNHDEPNSAPPKSAVVTNNVTHKITISNSNIQPVLTRMGQEN